MNIYQSIKRRIGMLPFMLTWTLGHIIPWGAFYLFAGDREMPLLTLVMLTSIVLGGSIGWMQKLLLRYAYHLPATGWVRLTMLGWIGGWASYLAMEEWIPRLYNYPLGLILIPMFTIPALLQWLILRRHVQSAWLWILAAAVSAVAFGFTYDASGYQLFGHLLSASTQAVVTGLSFLWLFGMTGVPIPQKKRDTSRLSLEYRNAVQDAQYHYNEVQNKHFIQG